MKVLAFSFAFGGILSSRFRRNFGKGYCLTRLQFAHYNLSGIILVTKECDALSTTMYLVIMLFVIAISALVVVPSLFLRRCSACKKRNSVEAKTCIHCGAVLDDGKE